MRSGSWLAVLAVTAILGLPAVSHAESAFETGERLAQSGDLDGALAAYQRAVATDPGSAVAQTRLGGMLLLKQQYGDAIRTFKVAIGLDGGNADAFVGLGMGYLHLGQYDLARAALTEARTRKPEKTQQIDEVIAWIDARESGAAKGSHP